MEIYLLNINEYFSRNGAEQYGKFYEDVRQQIDGAEHMLRTHPHLVVPSQQLIEHVWRAWKDKETVDVNEVIGDCPVEAIIRIVGR